MHTYGYYMNVTVEQVIIVVNSLDHVLVTMTTNTVLVKFIFLNNWVRHLKAPKISQTFRLKTQFSILSITKRSALVLHHARSSKQFVALKPFTMTSLTIKHNKTTHVCVFCCGKC